MANHDWMLHEVDGTICRACGCPLSGNAASTCKGATLHVKRLLADVDALQAVALRLSSGFAALALLRYGVDIGEDLAGVRSDPRRTLVALERAMVKIWPVEPG